MKKIGCLWLAMMSWPAYGVGVYKVHAFSAVTAGATHTSLAFDLGLLHYTSFQCVWASLTGSVNATVTLKVSNNGGADWNDKESAILTLSGANGDGEVSLVNATENLYQLVYTPGTVSGGTLDCWVVAK